MTDDRPYGGGPGMVMKIEPLVAAIRAAHREDPQVRIILLSPQGLLFAQDKARELAALPHLLLICGHYEGVSAERLKYYIDGMLSIGDYILTGGEIPALTVVDAVTRLLPGVLGRRRGGRRGLFSNRVAGVSPLHPAPGFRRPRGPPGVAGGRPPAHPGVAAATSPPPHPGLPAAI